MAMMTRRQLLTGGLTTAGLLAAPWQARSDVHVWWRGIGLTTTYTAKSPVKLAGMLRASPGYSPTLASVAQHLLQPGAAMPATTDPYQAALTLVQRPWFRGLGSPDPIGHPPLASVVRLVDYHWLDTDPSVGFHPYGQPVQRLKLVKAPAIERTYFKHRATVQTKKLYKALLRRGPRAASALDELSQGCRLLIPRTHAVAYVQTGARQPWLGAATAHAEVGDPPPSSAAPPFGSTLPSGDYFPSVEARLPADATTTHTAIEALAASAAFAEAAFVMGLGTVALAQAAHAAVGISTFGFLSALGLSVLLAISTVALTGLAVVVFYAIVSGRPRPDGTWDVFAEIAPFGSTGATGCHCDNADLAGVLAAISPTINVLSLELGRAGVIPEGELAPVATFTSDDAGPAPADGEPGDPGDDGGDF